MKKAILGFFKKFRNKKFISSISNVNPDPKKRPQYIVVICIYNEKNEIMFSCSEIKEGKIAVELMHSVFYNKKKLATEDMDDMALEVFNKYLNDLSELKIREFDFEEIEIESMFCHIIYIPNKKVKIMAYNKYHCLLDFTGFKDIKIQAKNNFQLKLTRAIAESAFNNSPVVKAKGDKLKSA